MFGQQFQQALAGAGRALRIALPARRTPWRTEGLALPEPAATPPRKGAIGRGAGKARSGRPAGPSRPSAWKAFIASGVLTGDTITDLLAGMNYRVVQGVKAGPMFFSEETVVQAKITAAANAGGTGTIFVALYGIVL